MPSSNFEYLIPESRQDFYDGKHLVGEGSRMIVFPSYDGLTVLRVPKRSEAQLIERFGPSEKCASPNGKNPLSKVTVDEIRQYEGLKNHLGQYTVGVIPFCDYDCNGVFRTYSTQRYVQRYEDDAGRILQLKNGFHINDISETAREGMRRFVRKVRKMVKNTGLIPDLMGDGNVLLDQNEKIKLVDINNIRPALTSESFISGKSGDYDEALNALRSSEIRREENGKKLRYYSGIHKVVANLMNQGVIHSEYLDDNGLPIADKSLDMLLDWEKSLGMVKNNNVDKDPFYQEFFNERRRLILHAIELHGG